MISPLRRGENTYDSPCLGNRSLEFDRTISLCAWGRRWWRPRRRWWTRWRWPQQWRTSFRRLSYHGGHGGHHGYYPNYYFGGGYGGYGGYGYGYGYNYPYYNYGYVNLSRITPTAIQRITIRRMDPRRHRRFPPRRAKGAFWGSTNNPWSMPPATACEAVRVYSGSAAEQAGLQAGDVISRPTVI